jgi:hypothetical protein
MGTTNQGDQPGVDNRNEKIYRGTILALVVIIALLSFFLITSRKSLNEATQLRTFTEELNMELQMELDSVLAGYNQMKLEYDSILVDKDSIIQASALEIQQLIARQADYNRIRRQLNGLREVTQNYVKEIDSLVTVNQVLRAENVQIMEEIRQVRARTTELAQDKEVLAGKVELAATVRAYQLDASAIRLRGAGREEETDRARRAEQIKVCFSLAENPIAPEGNRNIYIRIAAPDGRILRISDDDAYAFVHERDTLQFSVRGVVNYQNQEISKCLYWQRLEEFEPGIYMISLYSDEIKLGETSVALR